LWYNVANFVIPNRVFLPVFIGAQSVEIHQEMRELWSRIKRHVFMAHGVYAIKNSKNNTNFSLKIKKIKTDNQKRQHFTQNRPKQRVFTVINSLY